MADVAINSDSANIPAVNFGVQGSDPSAPGSGRAVIYVKSGGVYVRFSTGDPASVGGGLALAEGQLAIGDENGQATALALGSSGYVVTAGVDGKADWAELPAGDAGAFTLIEAVTVSGSPAANITFSNIPNSYSHLQLIGTVRTDRSSQLTDYVALQFDAITSGYYSQINYHYGGGGAESAVESLNGASGYVAETPGATATQYYPGTFQLWIPNYAGVNFYHSWRATGLVSAGSSISYTHTNTAGGVSTSTAAISSVKLLSINSANVIVGSTVSLYGVS